MSQRREISWLRAGLVAPLCALLFACGDGAGPSSAPLEETCEVIYRADAFDNGSVDVTHTWRFRVGGPLLTFERRTFAFGSLDDLLTVHFTHDEAGRITAVAPDEDDDGTIEEQQGFAYDEQGRVTAVVSEQWGTQYPQAYRDEVTYAPSGAPAELRRFFEWTTETSGAARFSYAPLRFSERGAAELLGTMETPSATTTVRYVFDDEGRLSAHEHEEESNGQSWRQSSTFERFDLGGTTERARVREERRIEGFGSDDVVSSTHECVADPRGWCVLSREQDASLRCRWSVYDGLGGLLDGAFGDRCGLEDTVRYELGPSGEVELVEIVPTPGASEDTVIRTRIVVEDGCRERCTPEPRAPDPRLRPWALLNPPEWSAGCR